MDRHRRDAAQKVKDYRTFHLSGNKSKWYSNGEANTVARFNKDIDLDKNCNTGATVTTNWCQARAELDLETIHAKASTETRTIRVVNSPISANKARITQNNKQAPLNSGTSTTQTDHLTLSNTRAPLTVPHIQS